MKKFFKDYKFSFGHLVLRILLFGLLNIVFFLLMFPFLQRAEGMPFEQAAQTGQINMWRIVFFYGLFTGIFVFITFWRKIFRTIAIALILCWLAGSGLVLFISSVDNQTTPTMDTPGFTGQQLFDAVNKYRNEKGVAELKLDDKLCNNLAQRYFDIKKGVDEGVAHKGLDEWFDKYVAPYGNYSVQEDFAYGNTPEDVVKAWEGSPGHRLSILDPKNKVGCSYASEGYGIIVLGYKLAQTSNTNSSNVGPSRTGRIISYHEWCNDKDISIYENELITRRSSDGNIYTMTQGDWDCYENFLKNKQ